MRSRETATLRGSLRSFSPGTAPSTPSFRGSFPSSLRSSFGEFGIGGPEAGQGNRNISSAIGDKIVTVHKRFWNNYSWTTVTVVAAPTIN